VRHGTPALQQEVAHYARQLYDKGWVANHDGNVSVRALDGLRYFCTPTATSKALVEPHDVLIVDLDGQRLSGRKRPFGEWHLHKAAYVARDDVRCVMHAHPPAATALGLAGKSFGTPALPEMIVSLGRNIPLLPYAMPKSAAQDDAIGVALTEGDADALLLAHNGVLTVGIDAEQAFLRMELVEHYANIYAQAALLGGVNPLPAGDVDKLLAARTKAGLGRAGRRG
jgi:L-fuculose-phosphate aldolase